MSRIRTAAALGVLTAGLSIPGMVPSASAFTGEEVMRVFDSEQRRLYFSGLVDMAAYQSALLGNTDRATCIIEWYYADDVGLSTRQRIEENVTLYPDQHVERVVSALAIRACGDPREDQRLDERPS